MNPDVVVIGAGAAGIFAAWRAAETGAKVLLIEKTERLGTKIRISGGGKCNVAHDGPLEEVLRAFRPNEARFIRPACYRFTNAQIIDFFSSRGLRVYTRPNGRVFPIDQNAKDVVEILRVALAQAGVEIWYNTPVAGLLHQDDKMIGVNTKRGAVKCSRVVLATGGSSYPKSGTTGDGWPWVLEVGHSLVKVRAALAPIHMVTNESWGELSGIALRGVTVKARQKGKELGRWTDDMLFTHAGVSGPTILGISRQVAEAAGNGEVTLELDLAPGQTQEQVAADLRDWAERNPARRWSAFVEDYDVPARLIPRILAAAGITNDHHTSNLPKKERNRLVETLKGWTIGTVRHAVLELGEVVAGGVKLDEVDPKTMRSNLVEGLYLCGEILDVAGPVGGYNLQAAFATGFVAGESAAKDALGFD